MSGQRPKLLAPVVNFTVLRDQIVDDVQQIFSKIRGEKAVIWRKEMKQLLHLALGGAVFKSAGFVAEMKLEDTSVGPETDAALLFVRPTPEDMQLVTQHIRRKQEADDALKVHVCFVPQETFLCTSILPDDVMASIETHELRMHLVPFDDDLLSMEAATVFKEVAVDRDETSLTVVANALRYLESVFGRVPDVFAKGDASVAVAKALREGAEDGAEDGGATEISQLIILDRASDLVSPMLHPLTYAGLIDEVVGTECGAVLVPAAMTRTSDDGKEPREGETARFLLNSNDDLFAKLRGFTVTALASELSRDSKKIQEQYEQRPQADKSVMEVKEFVARIPFLKEALKQVTVHVHVTERVTAVTNSAKFHRRWMSEREIIEGDGKTADIHDMIASGEPLLSILRFACLQSLVNNGFKPAEYDAIRRDLLQTFGFEQLITLRRLKIAGLLKPRKKTGQWRSIRDQLNLVVDNVDTDTPTDMAYVTSGVAPASCRVVERLLAGQWPKREDDPVLALPGKVARYLSGDDSTEGAAAAPTEGGRRVVLVFFVGGVTQAEIAALRLLGNREGSNCDIVIATTAIITGTSLLKQLVFPVPEGAM